LRVLLGVIRLLALTGLIAELLFRIWNPMPRVAVVRPNRVHEFWIAAGGVPLWSYSGRPQRCAVRRPGIRPVSFFGSSITYGSGLQRDQALAYQLEERLGRSVPGGACSDDYSEPAFGTEQQWAMASEAIPSTSPGVVVWEIWNPRKYFAVAEGVAYDAHDRDLDVAGVPVLHPVPSVIADPLFRWSHAYQYAAFALAPLRDPGPPDEDQQVLSICKTMLPDLLRLSAEHGAHVIALLGTRLDIPLAEAMVPSSRPVDTTAVVDCAHNLGIPVVSIAELLADQRVEDVRLDLCCHLNARGHALLAERLEANVMRAMPPDAP
jgi:hypothetical protein